MLSHSRSHIQPVKETWRHLQIKWEVKKEKNHKHIKWLCILHFQSFRNPPHKIIKLFNIFYETLQMSGKLNLKYAVKFYIYLKWKRTEQALKWNILWGWKRSTVSQIFKVWHQVDCFNILYDCSLRVIKFIHLYSSANCPCDWWNAAQCQKHMYNIKFRRC